MSVILIMIEDGSDDHSHISFIYLFIFYVVVNYPHSFQNEVIVGICPTAEGYSSHNHDLSKNIVFSCFHRFSAIFCLFFSPLTLAQLKTELLGSKFNSILEETTVRFLNKPNKQDRCIFSRHSLCILKSLFLKLPFAWPLDY